jgi:serpin B
MSLKTMVASLLTSCLVAAPGFLGAAQGPDQIPGQSPGSTESQANPTAAARANNEFGWSVFEQIRGTQRLDENMLFSPLSAWLALSLVSNGAEQETLQEIQNALRTNQYSLVQTNPLVRELIRNLTSNQRSTEVLRIANAVWVNSDSFDLSEKFQSDAQTFYSVLPEEEVVTSESFRQDSTLEHINDWVRRSTGGMIPSILDKLEPDMASILLNALYFQGQWLMPFAAPLTSNDSFHLADGSSKLVSMLRSGHVTPYASNGSYQMVSLAFRSATHASGQPELGRFQLDVVIPERAEGTIFNLQESDYQSLLQGLQNRSVEMEIPKFKFSYEKSLSAALQAIGIERAFVPGLAQMAPLGTPKFGADAFISEVLQKTAVEMDENGFKAAAVTAVIVGTTSAEPTPSVQFIADRPFFIALRDRVTGALLFQGIIANPEFR